jgi:hypothetical protein
VSSLEAAEELLVTDTTILLRLNGRPRSVDGRHRRMVVFVETTVSTLALVELLHAAADRLEAPFVACPSNKKPRLAGLSEERMMGLEPTTFCMASVPWLGSHCVANAHSCAGNG